jgi:hypothetical protein
VFISGHPLKGAAALRPEGFEQIELYQYCFSCGAAAKCGLIGRNATGAATVMIKLFDGLHSYEMVLVVLGCILFFVLVVLLVVRAIQNRSVAPLFLFFVVPVLIIGFPAVSKVKFDKDGVEIDKLALILAQNPSDETAKRKIETLVAQIKPRASESAAGLVKIARAEAILGQPAKAVDTLNQALKRNPELEVAVDLRSRLKVLPSTNEPVATRKAVEANIALKPKDE